MGAGLGICPRADPVGRDLRGPERGRVRARHPVLGHGVGRGRSGRAMDCGIYTLTYLYVGLAPALAASQSALRRFGRRGLWATATIGLFYLLVPYFAVPKPVPDGTPWTGLLLFERAWNEHTSLPSFHVVWACLASAVYASRWPRARWVFAAAAAAIAVSCVTTGMHALMDVAAAGVATATLVRGPSIWTALCRMTEAVANSWREWRVGPLRLLSHGVFAAAGTAAGVAVAVSLAGAGQLWWLVAFTFGAQAGAAIGHRSSKARPSCCGPTDLRLRHRRRHARGRGGCKRPGPVAAPGCHGGRRVSAAHGPPAVPRAGLLSRTAGRCSVGHSLHACAVPGDETLDVRRCPAPPRPALFHLVDAGRRRDARPVVDAWCASSFHRRQLSPVGRPGAVCRGVVPRRAADRHRRGSPALPVAGDRFRARGFGAHGHRWAAGAAAGGPATRTWGVLALVFLVMYVLFGVDVPGSNRRFSRLV